MPGIQSEQHIETILHRNAFTVEYDAGLTTLDDMYSVILELGYTPRLSVENNSEQAESLDSADAPKLIADALLLAQTENKQVFIDFYADWCIACKALEQQTLSSAEVQAALEHYLVLKIDTDAFPNSGVYLGVVAMPTIVVLNPTGKEIFRSVGPITSASLSSALNKLLSQ